MPEKTIQHGAVDGQAATVAVGPILPPLPEVRLGLLFAGSLLFADIMGAVVGDFGLHMFRILVLLAGVAYWLFCVYRLHRIVNELEPGYPISPEVAVGLHFPPFFSLFWIFKWPIEMSRFIRRRGATKIVPGGWIGLGIFTSVSIGQAYWGAGLASIFLLTWYLADKLSHEVQYHRVTLPPLEEALPAQVALGILAGNVVNYLVANTGFVLLLLLLNGGATTTTVLAAFALLFIASGYAAGVVGGNVARRAGPTVGILTNLAVLGSVAVGLYVSGQHDVSLPVSPLVVFFMMAAASFVLSTLGTSVGERWHQERRYPYLWSIEEKEAPDDFIAVDEDPDDQMPPAVRPAGSSASSAAQRLGGMALGNLTGILILVFYQYPAAFIEFIWGDQTYFITRMADGLIIVTGAFIAAYVAMLVAKEEPRAVGIGANLIMYLTMAGLILGSLMRGDLGAGLGGVLPFLPVVVIAGILGAQAAQTNLRGSNT